MHSINLAANRDMSLIIRNNKGPPVTPWCASGTLSELRESHGNCGSGVLVDH